MFQVIYDSFTDCDYLLAKLSFNKRNIHNFSETAQNSIIIKTITSNILIVVHIIKISFSSILVNLNNSQYSHIHTLIMYI